LRSVKALIAFRTVCCRNSRLIAAAGSNENGHQAETVQACADVNGLSTYTKKS